MTNYIEERLKDLYYDIGAEISGVRGGELFDSGYTGLVFYVEDTKCYVIDQPGVVGLEDHREAYIELRIGDYKEVIIRHRSRYFGDVSLTDEEVNYGYDKIIGILQGEFM